MNRYAAGGPSKATASTLCQKCLKRDSYECKAVAQERPYVSRPSRTQQLLNPKLVPKLTSEIPQELLRKKGVADEQLAKQDKERGRKRNRQDEELESSNKRNRPSSASAASSMSVRTISTDSSRSPRLQHNNATKHAPRRISAEEAMTNSDRKRRRSVSTEDSFPSDLDPSDDYKVEATSARSTRRKIGQLSPSTRGRRRSRSTSRGRRSSYSSDSRSRNHDRPETRPDGRTRHEGGTFAEDVPVRSHSRSPNHYAKRRTSPDIDESPRSYRDDSRSPHQRSGHRRRRSFGQEYGRRGGRDGTHGRSTAQDRSLSRDSHKRRNHFNTDDRYGANFKNVEHLGQNATQLRSTKPRRERSVSPFSKRLALTQAMNMGK